MTRRGDLTLALLLLEALVLAAALFLLWAHLRGFSPRMCDAYGACSWRRA
jgi:hypothetical protein